MITQWLAERYDLLRGLHIIAVIAWMAGMMFLPRLFVYHCRADAGDKLDVTMRDAENKVLRIIINPAMGLTFLFGIGLILADTVRLGGWGFLLTPWMLTKIAGILFLSAWHGFLSAARRKFANGTNTRPERFWRMTNEIPFVVAIIMVIAVTTEFGSR
jgi:putative membrane protein